jgi:hypothetical protein
MKFCKIDHIQEPDENTSANIENIHPNLQLINPPKTIEETVPKDYEYQTEI